MSFAGHFFSQCLQFLLLFSRKFMHRCVDFFNLSKFLVLYGFLLLQFLQWLLFLFNCKLNFIQFIVKLLVFSIQFLSHIFVDIFLCPGVVELNLNNLQLFLLLLFVFLLTFYLDLLFTFFLQQIIILSFKLSFKFFIVTDSLLDLRQFCFVGLEGNGKKLLFLLKLFIGDCILADRSNTAFIDGLILLHHGMQSFHFGLKFLYFLFGYFFVLPGKFKILVSFWNLSLEIRDGMGVIIGKLKGRL